MSRPSSSSADSGSRPSTGWFTSFWKNRGTTSARKPPLMTTTIRTIIRPRFFSTISCLIWSLPLRRLNGSVVLCCGFFLAYGHVHVVSHDQHAGQEDSATDKPDEIAGVGRFQRFNEAVGQSAVFVNCAPHQALHDAVNPHGNDVQDGTNSSQPEVNVDQCGAVHGLHAPEFRDQVIDGADTDHGYPAEGTGVHVADGPVSVVGQCVHGLYGHHRAFEGRHAVEGQGDHQEPQDRIGTQFVPSARQGHHAVNHAAPGGSQQNQGHDHACSLSPVRQGRVVQVVAAGPYVGRDQCPEVHDRQTVRVNRTVGLLGNEVVHHAQEAGSQEEANGVVAVPPLHHRIGDTGVG